MQARPSRFQHVLRAAGGPAASQTLKPRHTCASLSQRAGVHVTAVSRMLGHSKTSTTQDTYTDLFGSDLAAVADALEARYSGAHSAAPTPQPQAADADIVSISRPRRVGQ